MRRFLTWGLVAAVAALGLAAGIDAFRGGEPEAEPTPTGELEPGRRTLAAAGADLRRAGVPEGRLVYSDARCGVRALVLPDLAERPAHDASACASRRDGLVVAASPEGSFRTECAGGRLLVRGPVGQEQLYARGRGCDAAWKPNGTVTFVRDGEVRRFVRCAGDPPAGPLLCSAPVLTRVQLARQWDAAGAPEVREVAWLDDDRFATVVRRRDADYLVLFDRGRLVGEPQGPYGELHGLKPSPTGGRVAVVETERGRIVAVNGAGSPIPLAVDGGSGIAWSPDGRWVAEATEGGIYVWRAADTDPELIQIPVRARDLVWTRPADDDAAVLAALSADLRAAGVPLGTLTYADERCRSHALRLLSLAEEGGPAGYEGLCRYRAATGGEVQTQGPPGSPDGRVEAECAGGMLSLRKSEFGIAEPRLVARAPGCGAAWKPDGTVTFVQNGGVRRFVRCPGARQGTPLLCSAPVVTRADLRRQLGGGRRSVRELHWLDDRRFAAVVRERGFDSLVVVDRGRVLRRPRLGFEGLAGLRPSPGGRFVAAFERSGALAVVDRAGRPVHLLVQRGRGIAWSPDEEWVAVAGEAGIWVFRVDGKGRAPLRLPIAAEDVVWTAR